MDFIIQCKYKHTFDGSFIYIEHAQCSPMWFFCYFFFFLFRRCFFFFFVTVFFFFFVAVYLLWLKRGLDLLRIDINDEESITILANKWDIFTREIIVAKLSISNIIVGDFGYTNPWYTLYFA